MPPPAPPPSGEGGPPGCAPSPPPGAMPASCAGPGPVPPGGLGVSSGDRRPEAAAAMPAIPCRLVKGCSQRYEAAPKHGPRDMVLPTPAAPATTMPTSTGHMASPFCRPPDLHPAIVTQSRYRHPKKQKPAAYPAAKQYREATGLSLPKNFGAVLPFPREDNKCPGMGLSRLAPLGGLPLCQTVGLPLAEMDGQSARALQALDVFHGLLDALHFEPHTFMGLGARTRHTGQLAKQTVKIGVATWHDAPCPLSVARRA